MAKGANQKSKLLYLQRMFLEKTDENHGLTIGEIISYLKSHDINADRKTLYQDFEELRQFGLDILTRQEGHQYIYYLASREFELPELKLLVDSIQSAKFMTEKKSQQLIHKLGTLCSDYEAKQLQRQVIISGRIKTMNESIYYNVDAIHTAINEDRKIRFRYFRWNTKKEMELRRDGACYEISPWHLAWDDEYYYLIGFDSESNLVKHYRVDKMLSIAVTEDQRAGQETLRNLDIAAYSKRLFGMFGGEDTTVTLEVANEMAGIVIDRFGKDTVFVTKDEDHVLAKVDVIPSDQFLGWIFGLGGGVKIIAPENVVQRMKKLAERC